MSEAGEVPRTGFVMNYENYEFKVVESNEKNILKVEIRILDKENEPEESESSK